MAFYRKILPWILATLTGKARYLPEIKWSKQSWTHNVFRFYELIFWRKQGIRIENSSKRYTDSTGKRVTAYEIYTFEALCAHIETIIRQALKVKWLEIEIKELSFAVPNQELRIPFISFAIAYDTSSNGGATAAVSSDSWSHTVTGSETLIVGGSGVRDATAGDRVVSTLTYATVSLTSIRADDDTTATVRTELWQLVAPASGSNTVAISWGGNITSGCGMAISLTGVDQSTPNDANNGDHNSATALATVDIVTVADNAWIVDIMFTTEIGSSDITAGGTGTHTERQELDLASDNVNLGTAGAITPAGSTTVSWSWTGNEGWAISAASFKPSGGGTPAVIVIPRRMRMGVGI